MLRRAGCLLVVLFAGLASAQPTPRALFDEGSALYAKGDFAGAAKKFEASFAARPVPVTKFNIARSWEQAGETLKAIDAWQAWLLMSPGSPERPNAEQSLATLGAKLAKLGVQALTITSLPIGARVSIDGVAAGVTPLTVELTPTRHLLRVESDGRAPVERQLFTQLERPAVEDFDLSAADEAGLAPVPLTSATQPIYAPTVPRPIDAAFAAAGPADETVQVHITTDNREVRLYRASGNPNGECRAPCDAPIARASDAFFVGGAGITPSTTFILVDHARGGRVSLVVKPGSAGLVAGGTILTTVAVIGLVGALTFGILSGSSFSSISPGVPIGMGVGGAAAGVGAILMLVNAGTRVRFDGE